MPTDGSTFEVEPTACTRPKDPMLGPVLTPCAPGTSHEGRVVVLVAVVPPAAVWEDWPVGLHAWPQGWELLCSNNLLMPL